MKQYMNILTGNKHYAIHITNQNLVKNKIQEKTLNYTEIFFKNYYCNLYRLNCMYRLKIP